jgi:hypothetical protein
MPAASLSFTQRIFHRSLRAVAPFFLEFISYVCDFMEGVDQREEFAADGHTESRLYVYTFPLNANCATIEHLLRYSYDKIKDER